jgi:hypothetical protein
MQCLHEVLIQTSDLRSITCCASMVNKCYASKYSYTQNVTNVAKCSHGDIIA